ncbi:nuclear transport factor 2 family protein [Geminocystis herdmanii]|uniref:nuclear transport factor 2 family protein n=1 Tax=Geminocystis herdmanii TaxID=669359 RepID=UPI00034C1818|nr:SgcJ/EcaC family oxidoreductase [Geminocystis herdmanii]
MNDYRLLVDRAIKACMEKNASRFSSLFTEDGEIILNQNLCFSKQEIEEVTHKYFVSLKYVKIETKYIIIERNKAFIQWSWSDFNLVNNQENSHDNVIVLDFKDNLIYRWREYKG